MGLIEDTLKVNYSGLLIESLPSGRFRYRVRVSGNKKKRIRIHCGPDHPQFQEQYLAARAGVQPEKIKNTAENSDIGVRGSLGWLLVKYMTHFERGVEEGKNSPKTLRKKRNLFSRLTKHSDKNMNIPVHHLVRIQDQMSGTPAQADALMEAMGVMFKWAIKRGYMKNNPVERIDRIYKNGGQIIGATLVSAPRQRNSDEEKKAIKQGKSARQIWPDQPNRAAQKDTEAKWTVKFSRARTRPDGAQHAIDIAIPFSGYKNHILIDQRHGIIRREKGTDASAHDGARLREGLMDGENTGSDVWADTAYRSSANEEYPEKHGKKAAFISGNPGAGQCRLISSAAMSENPESGKEWSMSLANRNRE